MNALEKDLLLTGIMSEFNFTQFPDVVQYWRIKCGQRGKMKFVEADEPNKRIKLQYLVTGVEYWVSFVLLSANPGSTYAVNGNPQRVS
jgi:hypothetical protein